MAEAGSISAAAHLLHVSQPTLTRQLGGLERRLGVALFERSSDGVRLTAAGEVFVARGRTVLRSAELLDEEMQSAAVGRAGRLRLGFVGSAINGPLGAAIGRLRDQMPDVDLDLHEAFDDRILAEEVRSGDLDIAVHRLPVRDPALASTAWSREPMSVFFPEDHRFARDGAPLPVSAIRSVDLVMWPRESAPQAYDEVMALLQRAGATPRIVATAHTVQAILALVAAGVGVAVMSDSYRTLRRAGVRARPVSGQTVTHFLTTTSPVTSPLVLRALSVLAPDARADEQLPVSPVSPSVRPG